VVVRLPRYPLDRVQKLVAGDRYRITDSARRGALALGLDESDVVECVAALAPRHFYKTMESWRNAGTWQDVYRGGISLYVKLQIVGTNPTDLTVVISFKRL
jgi:motility quorum-sensing regulator/GCU-specific mRNA interferase toxin